MVMMTLPLLLLYEVGVAGAALVYRRRKHAAIAGLILVGLGLGATPARAQVPVKPRPVPTRGDSLRARADSLRDSTRTRAGQVLDSATARRLGLPTAPSRSFAPPDSVVNDLLKRPGYQATRYRADSATVFVPEERVLLQGEALTERLGSLLEADTITYRRNSCLLDAHGTPPLRQGPGADRRGHQV